MTTTPEEIFWYFQLPENIKNKIIKVKIKFFIFNSQQNSFHKKVIT